MSHSPVIEVGGERDTSINSSAAASMTEFREVKSTADRVGLEVKSQLDNDVSQSPVIEVGGEMRMKKAHADATSMTKCSEVKPRARIITDDAEWRAKIERGRRIFERIRVRTDKVAKSA